MPNIPRGGIAQNDITYWSGAVAGGLSVYIMTFGGVYVFAGIVSGFMLLFGLVFSDRLRLQRVEELPEPGELGNLGLYATLALGAFIVFTYVLNLIYYTPAQSTLTISTWFGLFNFDLSTASGQTAGVIFIAFIIPNAEEQFFRGLFGNAAISVLGVGLGAVGAGAIFAAFHIAVDGFNAYILTSIALDGAVIIAFDLSTGSLLTGLIAHGANNLLSFVLKGSVLTILGAPAFHYFPVQAIVPTVMFGYLIVKQRGRIRTLCERHLNDYIAKAALRLSG